MSSRRPHDEPYTDETIPMRVPPPARRAQPPADRGRRQPPPKVPPPLQPARRPTKQRGNPVGRWLRRLALLLVAGLIVACVGTFVLQQRVASKAKLADVRQNRPAPNLLVTPMNVLLLGVDLRPDHPEEGIRSDTLIMLHLDPAGGWGSLLSIPRDSVAEIPGFGENKINTAFARGYENAAELYGAGTDPTAAGAALAADTVEQFLGLREQNARINYVATINFNGFAKMIDAIGGIDVNVPHEIVDDEYPTEDFGITTVRFPAGPQHLNGTEALQYVRTRHADSDFGRAERQQQVIEAIVQALRNQPLLLRPISALRLVDAAGDATRTTMPVGRPDALLMATMLTRIGPGSIAQYRINPDVVGMQEYGSDLVWDPAGIQGLVREALAPAGEAQEQATIQVQNGAGVAGIAGQMTEALRTEGFTLSDPSNAEQTAKSQIIDYGDHPATRKRLSKALGGMPVVERTAPDSADGVDLVVVLGEDYPSYWEGK